MKTLTRALMIGMLAMSLQTATAGAFHAPPHDETTAPGPTDPNGPAP